MKALVPAVVVALAAAPFAGAAPVLPGYLTDPSVVKGRMPGDGSYQPPERLKYPYVSTYYVKPTVTTEESVKIGFFVTDFESSKIRFLDDSHRFAAFLEYRPKGGSSKTVVLKGLKSGDAAFDLGRLPAGAYEMRIWAVDAKGRESHRVIHDFRVVNPKDLEIPADKVYTMTKADLAAYGIRNDGDLERIVYVGTNGTAKVVKEKRAGVPGYTVTVPMDPKTGKAPIGACKKAKALIFFARENFCSKSIQPRNDVPCVVENARLNRIYKNCYPHTSSSSWDRRTKLSTSTSQRFVASSAQGDFSR